MPSEILSYQSRASPGNSTCIPIFVQAQSSNGSGAQPPPATLITITDIANPAISGVGHVFNDPNCSGTEISFSLSMYYQEQILFYENVTKTFSSGLTTNLQVLNNMLAAGPQPPVSMKLPNPGFPVSISNSVITQNSVVPWSRDPTFLGPKQNLKLNLFSIGQIKVDAGESAANECTELSNEMLSNVTSAASMVSEISVASHEQVQVQGVDEVTKSIN